MAKPSRDLSCRSLVLRVAFVYALRIFEAKRWNSRRSRVRFQRFGVGTNLSPLDNKDCSSLDGGTLSSMTRCAEVVAGSLFRMVSSSSSASTSLSKVALECQYLV